MAAPRRTVRPPPPPGGVARTSRQHVRGDGTLRSGRPRFPRQPRLAGLILIVLLAAVLGSIILDRSPREAARTRRDGPAHLVVRVGNRVVLSKPAGQATLRHPPSTVVVRRGSARITYRVESRPDGSLVRPAVKSTTALDAHAVASEIAAPAVAQRLRNNCESAALQVLLATVGVDADQLRLQNELPRSGSVDPRGAGDQRVWGDPEQGFVGRPDGGGVAGGFGVYQRPVRAVAARHGVALKDLSGSTPAVIYRQLLAGHAVMVWVGLGDGPFTQWRSPQGRLVEVNLNEHAVVLTGVRAGRISVVNVLQGTRERWTRGEFELMWARLGRRALAA